MNSVLTPASVTQAPRGIKISPFGASEGFTNRGKRAIAGRKRRAEVLVQPFGLRGKQKKDWEKVSRSFSPFNDPEPSKARYNGNRWAGDPETRETAVRVGGVEYRGRVHFFPTITRVAKKARRSAK